MNIDEEIAKKCLKQFASKSIVYEPDGNQPPDFLIDGRVAVEVRRLSKSVEHTTGSKDLHETSAPIWQGVQKLANKFPSKAGETVWFVCLDFSRPLPKWKKLRPIIRDIFQKFYDSGSKHTLVYSVSESFEIEFIQGSSYKDTYFCMGALNDLDAAGWVVSDVIENLPKYISEKTSKIAPHKDRYPEWWLFFVDRIGYGEDGDEVRKYISKPKDWDKIMIAGPLNNRVYEI